MTRIVATLNEILASPLPAADKLEQLIEVHFAFCRENPDRARFVYALFFGPLARSLATELIQYAEAMRAIMHQAVGLLAVEGLIDAAEVEACAGGIRGLITVSTMDFLYRAAPLDADLPHRCVQQVLQGFLRGACSEYRARPDGNLVCRPAPESRN